MLNIQYDRSGITDRRGDRDPKKRAKEIIAKLDTSGDKKLSKEEFVNGYVRKTIQLTLEEEFFSVFFRCKNDPVICDLLTSRQ